MPDSPLSAPLRNGAAAAPTRPLIVLLMAACAGIAADRYLAPHAVLWWGVGLVAVAAWFLAWIVRRDRIAAVPLLAALAAAGGAWHHWHWHLVDERELGLFATELNRPVVVEGTIVSSPRIGFAPPHNPMRTIPEGDKTRCELTVERLRDGVAWRSAAGNAVLLVDGHVLAPRVGDRVRVCAMLSAPSPPENPGQFDFGAFERASGRYCLLRAGFPESVQLIDSGASWAPRRLLDDARRGAKDLLHKHVDERQAGLAAALLLGARGELDQDRIEDFFATGAIHLLAISGLHVGILALGVWALGRLGLLPRRATLLAVVLLVCVYALFTEARPPVLRAAVLISAFCLARYCGRPAASFNVLALAAFVVLAIGPAQLFQVGTQLSFLAVATLLVCGRWLAAPPPADPLDRLIAHTRPWPLRTAKAFAIACAKLWFVSTVVWLAALPLVMHQFHLVAPASVALNPLLWLPVATALFSGFLVILCGWLVPPLGDVFGWICRWSLESIEWTLRESRAVPGSHFWVAGPSLWWVVGFYALIGLLLAVPMLRARPWWCAAILTSWISLGWIAGGDLPLLHDSRGKLECTFVSVGHGTSVLLELPDGRTLLYDAGTLGSPEMGGQAVAGTLWSRGISHLDAIIVSHADADHYNGLPVLLERFSVGAIYVSPVMFRNDVPALAALRESIEESGVPLRELSSLDRLATPEQYRLEVLHPLPTGVSGSDNANSIVLLVEFAGRRILLTGDLEPPGAEDLLAESPLDCDVLMAPHHGSAKSRPAEFSAWSRPEVVIISSGHDDDTAAMKQPYQQDGAQVLHTAEAGAVRVSIDEGSLTVRSWRSDGW